MQIMVWIFLAMYLLVSGILFSIGHVFTQNAQYAGFLSGLLFLFLALLDGTVTWLASDAGWRWPASMVFSALIIYLLFFGGSGAAMTVARVFGYTGYIELNAFAIGTVAIGFISGAYSTEVLRGAFLAV